MWERTLALCCHSNSTSVETITIITWYQHVLIPSRHGVKPLPMSANLNLGILQLPCSNRGETEARGGKATCLKSHG